MVGATVKEVGKQLNKVFTVDEIKKEIITKLGTLEKRIDSSVFFSQSIFTTLLWWPHCGRFSIIYFCLSFAEEGRRLVEMEKYKLDLVELRDSIYNKSTNTLDYNRLRCSNHFGLGSHLTLMNIQQDDHIYLLQESQG